MTKEHAMEQLNKWIKRGDTVYTVLRHVTRSGMNRSISLIHIRDGEPHDISGFAAAAIDCWKFDQKNGGIKIDGGGEDKGFVLVYNLSIAMYCPKKYNHNDAYSLNHRWL